MVVAWRCRLALVSARLLLEVSGSYTKPLERLILEVIAFR